MAGEWAEYLEAATAHLHATRRAVERGAPSPPEPARPAGPLPDGLRPEAQRLSMAYDQLALEAATRLAEIGARLTGPRRAAAPPPQFVDHRA
ncbi:MAG TPA: hypothetical protein VEG62_02660 [Acidimicrobiales bacterium]|nr:hypothetical protein [Acidimicrobiales bacterium]